MNLLKHVVIFRKISYYIHIKYDKSFTEKEFLPYNKSFNIRNVFQFHNLINLTMPEEFLLTCFAVSHGKCHVTWHVTCILYVSPHTVSFAETIPCLEWPGILTFSHHIEKNSFIKINSFNELLIKLYISIYKESETSLQVYCELRGRWGWGEEGGAWSKCWEQGWDRKCTLSYIRFMKKKVKHNLVRN